MTEKDSSGTTRVGLVVVSHSRKLAEGVVELAREMAGPDVRLVGVGGLALPGSPLGTDPEAIRQAIEKVYSADGVLVLLDLGSALLSAELAVELLPEEWRPHVRLADAPLVEGAVAAAVQARLGSPLERVAAEARQALSPKLEHLRSEESGGALGRSAASEKAAGSWVRLVVRNPHGLHARPAARLVQVASQFRARVTVTNLTAGRGPADARSLSALATLDVRRGGEIQVAADGPDADAALAAIREVVEAADEVSGDDSRGGPPAVAAGSLETLTPLRGLTVAPGVGIGKVRVERPARTGVAEMPMDEPEVEWEKLSNALANVRADVAAQRDRLRVNGDLTGAQIFEAHLALLADPVLVDTAHQAITSQSISAAVAWQSAIDRVVKRFQGVADRYLAERASDVVDLGQQVLADLGPTKSPVPRVEEPALLIVPELLPSLVSRLDPVNLRGLGAAFGGPTAHGAILARSLGVPVVVGLGSAILDLPDGTPAILDADKGILLTHPDSATLARYAGQTKVEAEIRETGPVHTLDGRRVHLAANVGSLADARVALRNGAEGIGLFRTEFLFLDRTTPPSEDEQCAAYRAIAEVMAGRPVVIRTLDAGGDKPLPYLSLQPEANPFLGQRGIRLCLAQPALFASQLRAIARVAEEFPVKVMFPMVATLAEWREARAQLDKLVADMRVAGLRTPDRLEAGIMVEVPATALRIADFAAEVDFFSIGTNDLGQYLYAADRGNAKVAALGDGHQPAMLGLIGDVVRAAHLAGKPVTVCGEMASDPSLVPILIGLGVDELSVSPVSIPSVERAIRQTNFAEAAGLAQAAQRFTGANELRAWLG